MFPIIKPNNQSLSRRKPIYGAGINDADYVTSPKINGKQITCHFYNVWRKLIAREYSSKFSDANPTYKNCTVCKEWIYFSNFKGWMIKQDWKGKELDKDIIKPGNKHYSPDTCCFIPSALNNLMTGCDASRGDYPIGVCWDKVMGKFLSQVRYCGEKKYLGHFYSPEQASNAYIKAKVKIIIEAASEQTDKRVSNGLKLHANLLLDGLSS